MILCYMSWMGDFGDIVLHMLDGDLVILCYITWMGGFW